MRESKNSYFKGVGLFRLACNSTHNSLQPYVSYDVAERKI